MHKTTAGRLGYRGLATTGAALLIALAGERSAIAAESAERSVLLRFSGIPGCNDRSALEREVERRVEGVSFRSEATAQAVVSVGLSSTERRVDSTVVIERESERTVTRTIAAGSCQEALEGAALIIAVVLSRTEESNEPERATPPPPELKRPPPPAPAEARWRFGGGTSLVLVRGLAPGIMPGVEGFLSLGREDGGLLPIFRLGVRHLQRSGFELAGGEAGFRLTAASASACIAAWSSESIWLLRPCAVGSYGILSANGGLTGQPERSAGHPWASAGLGLRLEARVLSALALELEGSVETPLFESRFSFGSVRFFEVSRVTERLGVNVVARIH